MKSWQFVRLMAGLFILLSLALGVEGSPLFVSPWWLAFTAFVGVNLLQSGLTLALEPMLLVGTPLTRVMPDEWTVCSQDGSLTAHWEHTVAVTPEGPQILTLLEDGSAPAQIVGPRHLVKEPV